MSIWMFPLTQANLSIRSYIANSDCAGLFFKNAITIGEETILIYKNRRYRILDVPNSQSYRILQPLSSKAFSCQSGYVWPSEINTFTLGDIMKCMVSMIMITFKLFIFVWLTQDYVAAWAIVETIPLATFFNFIGYLPRNYVSYCKLTIFF